MSAAVPRLRTFAFALVLTSLGTVQATPAHRVLELANPEQNAQPVPAPPQPPAPALFAGQSSTLRILPAPSPLTDSTLSPTAQLFQLGGALSAPLDTVISVTSDPADPRLLLVQFTAPPASRPTRFALRIGDAPPIPLHVYPATRDDLPSLVDALASSRLTLAVSGPSPELRAWLRTEHLDYEDLGADTPDRIPADTLLLATLTDADWTRLTTRSPDGRLLACIENPPTSIPGVYSDSLGLRAKITFPLISLLPSDPRARETFHTLLLQALPPATPR